MNDPIAFLYGRTTDELKALFGRRYIGPEVLHHAEEVEVAFFDSKDDDNACDVVVSCYAVPSTFYTVKVFRPGERNGEPLVEFSTGSGESEMAFNIASKIFDGMLDVKAGGKNLI